MSIAIVTGSGGLIGSEAVRFLTGRGLEVIGIDNDMRARFFGPEASTRLSWTGLQRNNKRYTHIETDIRDSRPIDELFARFSSEIALVVHAAAQPSHDWAAQDPPTDFMINAGGTLNMLQATRRHCPEAVFIFCSTNKVYGDTPNRLPLIEQETRWDLPSSHRFGMHGIDESMTIDNSMHSLFGVSKCAADLMVQEYGRYFGMRTACFRCGCVTGPTHAGAFLHGFLSYLVKCAVSDQQYTIIGYKGKQVRDNIHAFDLANAFWHFFENPQIGAVYNIGGGRYASCSVIEAIRCTEDLTGHPMKFSYSAQSRAGDHVWWISDNRRFARDYPNWRLTRNISDTILEIYGEFLEKVRLSRSPAPRRRRVGVSA
ncbi:MAG: NAD-dependent epimerase/dehydratase family protein [Acetobacteraceae bacterium]|nr:NAD-dependent epimerase/dehydratase family protein [Acetobacteraceae bacterium]